LFRCGKSAVRYTNHGQQIESKMRLIMVCRWN
jgi:hypothetical protein